ncbi:RrF2 family transcriptional regulator [Candidatus Caldatribacterium sp. SIUC1]|uniref:RrF2 family transcriptional regulator n=1 Tax=Candidatus Caldatribacterium sp. SIUC1 TaxID=3418365 RepID=UPI003F690948
MVELALSYDERGFVFLRDIAKREEISEKYLGQLIIPLRSAGLISSKRGAEGGYQLARPPETITVLEIVEALEGKVIIVDCLRDEALCQRASSCAAREVWKKLQEAIVRALGGITLAEVVRIAREKSQLSDYSI